MNGSADGWADNLTEFQEITLRIGGIVVDFENDQSSDRRSKLRGAIADMCREAFDVGYRDGVRQTTEAVVSKLIHNEAKT